jgi:hypothetical protein
MTDLQRVLLTPGMMGPAEWADVSSLLTGNGHRVVVDTELKYDRGMAAAAGSQLERLRDPAFWTSFDVDHVEVAVGFSVGAGPAAAMVADGRATSAVLIDPDLTMFAMTHPNAVEVLAPRTGLELALEISERLEPFNENLKHGPFTREMVDIMCGAFTGETWRIKQADLVAPFIMNRVAIDRSQLPTETDLHSSDWASFAANAAVVIWLSAGREPLADYLRGHGLNVSVTGWGQAPWIESAEDLASAIESEARRVRHRYHDPGRGEDLPGQVR